jgi:hypothetical protein
MLKSCKICGLSQEHDLFPKMNVQYGKQYYRTTCAQCTYKVAKTYEKNPSKSADAYTKKGLNKPGRPKLEYKPCARCKTIMHRSMFSQWGARVSSYCKECSNVRYRESRKKKKEKTFPDSGGRFIVMMNAFRPQNLEGD